MEALLGCFGSRRRSGCDGPNCLGLRRHGDCSSTVDCVVVLAVGKAARAHAGSIRSISLACFPEEFADADAKVEMENDTLGVLAGFHDVDVCQWLLAMQGGETIGVAMLVPYHDSLYVSSLAVLQQHRKRGIGSLLMRSASAHAAKMGLPALSGSVSGSKHLIRYYTALGGQLQREHAIASDGALVPATRMRAPSGAATAHGVAAPLALEAPAALPPDQGQDVGTADEHDGCSALRLRLDDECQLVYWPDIGLGGSLTQALEAALAASEEQMAPPPEDAGMTSGAGRRQWFVEVSPLGWPGPRRWRHASWRLASEEHTDMVRHVRDVVESAVAATCEVDGVRLRESYNTCLINRYPTGVDAIKWHADDERWYSVGPAADSSDIVIASVSLGAERWFEFRSDPRRVAKEQRRHLRLRLRSGSLLLMAGATQRQWQHSLPRDAGCEDVRYNLTFRRVLTAAEDSRLLSVREPPGQCPPSEGHMSQPQVRPTEPDEPDAEAAMAERARGGPIDVEAASEALARARAQLTRLSERETALPGMPTGALLVERKHARAFCAAFKVATAAVDGRAQQSCRAASSKAGSQARLGAPTAVEGTGEAWLLFPLSTAAAARLPALLAAEAELERLVESGALTFFAGVRRCGGGVGIGVGTSGSAGATATATGGQPRAAGEVCGGCPFTFCELFAGIGGFRLGLEPLGGRCVFASDICPLARETYSLNFGAEGLVGDVIDQYAHSLPPFDVLTAGFPCQPFSQSGKQEGFADSRGRLYLELVRVLVVCQPRAFLFENVPQLAVAAGGWRPIDGSAGAHEGAVAGELLQTMIEAFAGAGYRVSWRLLDSRRWVAQKRLRLYVVGVRSDLADAGISFPSDALPDGVRAPCVRECLEPADAAAVARAALSPQQWARISSDEFCAKSNRSVRSRAIALDGAAPTLIASYRSHALTTKYVCEEADGTARALPRHLTTRECAALMGFPPDFRWPEPRQASRGAPGFGEGEAYKQLGNAVVPPVITAIGEHLLRAASMSPAPRPEPKTPAAAPPAEEVREEGVAVAAAVAVTREAGDATTASAAVEVEEHIQASLVAQVTDGHLSLPAAVPRALRGQPLTFPAELGLASRVTLSSAQLTEIPPALRSSPLPRLLVLDLSYNAIKALPEPAAEWEGLRALVELNLSHNLLKALPAAMQSAARLRTLNLRSNQLREWRQHCAAALAGLSELKRLDLRYNPRLSALDTAALGAVLGPGAAVGERGSPSVLLGAEQGVSIRRGSAYTRAIPGNGPGDGWPTLLAQLTPLSTPAILWRLHSSFGIGTGRPDDDYAAVGSSRDTLLQRLATAYEERAAAMGSTPVAATGHASSRCRREVRHQGASVPEALCDRLLEALRGAKWASQTDRPKVAASGYIVLERESSPRVEGDGDGGGGERRRESAGERRRRAKREQHGALWDAVVALVGHLDPGFAWTGVALSNGFRGSPHVDTYDLSYQWAVSLGDFEGGELCIESAPDEVGVVDTRRKPAKVDGRYIHWVAPWSGEERYSVIIYKTAGEPSPMGPAVHPHGPAK